ncbi:O-methyltransferase-domain-containing protein [Rhodotorula toruloides]
MPTYITTHTGGTPTTRAASLLSTALSQLDPSSPAYSTLVEAHSLVAGEETYIERNTSELIVPAGHAVLEQEVREVWDELLRGTTETDWKAVKDREETTFELGAGMCSGPYEAVVLQNFALMQGAKTVLEIGVFTGTATLALALLPSVTQVVALDIEPFLESFNTPYWTRAGVSSKIDLRIAPALESLAKLKQEGHEGFDLVFIDADKPSYRTYVEQVLELGLLKENGVILVDNTLYKVRGPLPAPLLASSLTPLRFGRDTRGHPDLETAVLPIRDGITVIRRRI